MITLVLVAAALAFWFWPRGASVPKRLPEVPAADVLFRVPPQAAAPPAPPPTADTDPRPAIDQILRVRDRLAGTGRLDEANAAAVDRLVLELVHGKAEAK
jgi:hypothetical protein